MKFIWNFKVVHHLFVYWDNACPFSFRSFILRLLAYCYNINFNIAILAMSWPYARSILDLRSWYLILENGNKGTDFSNSKEVFILCLWSTTVHWPAKNPASIRSGVFICVDFDYVMPAGKLLNIFCFQGNKFSSMQKWSNVKYFIAENYFPQEQEPSKPMTIHFVSFGLPPPSLISGQSLHSFTPLY